MNTEPTPRQAEALAFIRMYIRTKGFSPSSREVADSLGVTQTAAVRKIKALERGGLIRTSPGIPRSIVLL